MLTGKELKTSLNVMKSHMVQAAGKAKAELRANNSSIKSAALLKHLEGIVDRDVERAKAKMDGHALCTEFEMPSYEKDHTRQEILRKDVTEFLNGIGLEGSDSQILLN